MIGVAQLRKLPGFVEKGRDNFVKMHRLLDDVRDKLILLFKHPCFDEMRKSGKGYRVVEDYKNTNRIINDSYWIGVYPGMTDEKLDICLRSFMKHYYSNKGDRYARYIKKTA